MPSVRSVLLLLLASSLLACQPEIGDPCTLPSDCSVSGDRLCDPTFRGGYCTRFNCEPGGCPDEAICVAYRGEAERLDGTCSDYRFRRTFCMKGCKSHDDCRKDEGYQCLNVEAVEAWSAVVVERGSVSHKVCAPPYSGAPPGPAPPICTATAADGFPDPLVPPPLPLGDAGRDGLAGDAALRDGAGAEASPLPESAPPQDAFWDASWMDARTDAAAPRAESGPAGDAVLDGAGVDASLDGGF